MTWPMWKVAIGRWLIAPHSIPSIFPCDVFFYQTQVIWSHDR